MTIMFVSLISFAAGWIVSYIQNKDYDNGK